MFAALGKFNYSHRKWIVAVSVVVFLLAVVFGTGAIDRLKPGGFEDENSESFVAKELLAKELGQGQSNLFVVFSSGHLAVDDPRFQSAVEEALAPLAQDEAVARVDTFYTTGSPTFVSEDGTETFAVVGLTQDVDTASDDFPRLRSLLSSEELEINVTGPPAANREIQDKAESDLQRAELFAFPIVAILLVLILGSLVAASLPLAMGILLLCRLLPKGGWIARWPMAFFIGVFAGIRLIGHLDGDFVIQIGATIDDIQTLMPHNKTMAVAGIIKAGLIVTCVLSGLVYFLFSVEHKGIVGKTAKVGIWFLMITFGAGFGFTVMGRIALLASRFEFLVDDWLWIIDPRMVRTLEAAAGG